MTVTPREAMSQRERLLVPLGLLAYLVLSLIVVLTQSGTYDAGDSIMHYQIARWAFVHPENFLSHWGKPVFTILASPWTQLGFGGMKVLQCLLTAGTGWMLWRSAWRLGLQHRWLAPLLCLAGPEVFLAQQSGLTEPLFACVLLMGVWLMLEERPLWGAMVLSLLPFVRTEGFLLLPVAGLWLLWRRQWGAIPLLALGTAVFMVVGGWVKGNFLWIWTENPYAHMSQNYGIGGITHFPVQYLFVVGIPIYGLTALGLLAVPVHLMRRTLVQLPALLVLVLGPWMVYFGAHMYFWATGTGHSMGLIRVLIGIAPLGALLALSGLHVVMEWVPLPRLRQALVGLVALYVALFPMIPNPAAIHAEDLQLAQDQQLMVETGEWLQANGLMDRKFYCGHPSAAFTFGIDPFDRARYRALNRIWDETPAAGCLVLWDGWFGKVEAGLTRGYFEGRATEYRLLKEWHGQAGETPIDFVLYEKI